MGHKATQPGRPYVIRSTADGTRITQIATSQVKPVGRNGLTDGHAKQSLDSVFDIAE